MDNLTQASPHQPLRVSILIPAYNEGDRIKRLIIDVKNQFNGVGFKDYEIIVVNDGSIDKTHLVLSKFKDIKYVNLDHNVGKGNALKVAFEYATGQIIVFLDGDNQIHPGNILRYIEQLEKSRVDIVIASKRHPQSVIDYPVLRKIVSDGYHKFVEVMFRLKLSDTQTGFKVFKVEALKRIFPMITCKLYAFDLEILLLAKKIGYRILERPIQILDVAKYKTFSFWDIYHTFKDTLSIWYRYYIKKSYVFHSYNSERP